MTIKGRVYNSRTGAGIPYASITVVDEFGRPTGVGNAANADGSFTLSSGLIGYPNAVVFSSSGYKPNTIDADFFVNGESVGVKLTESGVLPIVNITSHTNTDKKKKAPWLILGLVALLILNRQQ
jgi:hypothetical protein